MTANLDAEYKKCKELKKEDVAILKEWINKEQHLPKISEFKIIIFLHSCYHNIEKTKLCIENYYTVKTKCPEIFSNRSFKDVRTTLETTLFTYLPKHPTDGYNIFFTRILDTNPDKYNFVQGVKSLDMTIALNQNRFGTSPGEVIIFDTQGPSFAHLLKVNLTVLKKYMYFLQEALPVRIKAIHVTHASGLADKLLNMVKPFIKGELINSIHLHQNLDTLYDYIPKEVLPKEYGGFAGTLENFKEQTLKLFDENDQFFIEDQLEICDESKRHGKSTNVDDIFGTQGTFKRLDID